MNNSYSPLANQSTCFSLATSAVQIRREIGLPTKVDGNLPQKIYCAISEGQRPLFTATSGDWSIQCSELVDEPITQLHETSSLLTTLVHMRVKEKIRLNIKMSEQYWSLLVYKNWGTHKCRLVSIRHTFEADEMFKAFR